MKRTDLSAQQLKSILDAITPANRYLRKLADRMHQVAFDPNDDLAKLVGAAHNELDRLAVHLHYWICDATRKERE